MEEDWIEEGWGEEAFDADADVEMEEVAEEERAEAILRLIRQAQVELEEALMSEGEWAMEKIRIALGILYDLERMVMADE